MARDVTYSADIKRAKGEPVLAAVYARYSSHSQTEQSIEGQLDAAKKYADAHGYTIVKEYCDRAQTGRNDNRAEFQRMMADTDKKQFDVIIAWKLDRIGRSREDLAANKYRCKRSGIRIEYVAESLPDSPEAVILESVLEGMAEYYSLQLSTNIRRGRQESAKKCQHLGGPVPFGYAVDPQSKRYIPNEKTAGIAAEIFKRYADGATETELIQWLNGLGMTTTAGKPFGRTSLATLLHSKKYTGVYVYRDGEIDGGMPALISKDLYDKVQEMLKMNRRAPSRTWTKIDFLLSGKLVCGKCGAPLIGMSGFGRHGEKYSYYICTRRRREKGCALQPLKKDAVEKRVEEATRAILKNDQLLELIAEKAYAFYQANDSGRAERQAVEGELQTCTTAITNLTKAVEQGMPYELVTARLQELRQQQAALSGASSCCAFSV